MSLVNRVCTISIAVALVLAAAPLVAQARVLGDLVEAIVATGEQRSPE